MRVKILSKLAIAQLACLPLISISCGKHEQKAKENLVAVITNPKFDKLIDKNKEEKTDKNTPIVEKIEVVNNDEDESEHIEKSKKVEVKNPNNPNSPINVEVKNDIKIDNKINTKDSKLKTFFAVVGGLATAAAVGYGLWWLFRNNEVIEVTKSSSEQVTKIHSNYTNEVEITFEYSCSEKCEKFNDKIKAKNGFIFTRTVNTFINYTNNSKLKLTIKGPEYIIYEIISLVTTTYNKTYETNWERLLKKLKEFFDKSK